MMRSRFSTYLELLRPVTYTRIFPFIKKINCLPRQMCNFNVLSYNVEAIHLDDRRLYKQRRIQKPMRKVTRNISDVKNTSIDIQPNSAHQDQLMNSLANASSVDDVFLAVGSNEYWLPSHVAAAFATLDKLIFNQLADQPWALYNNPIMLYIQSFVNNESREVFQPILQCPEFDQLCSEARKQISSFCNRDLVNVTVNLLRLHVNVSSDIFRDIVLECIDRHQEFDLEDLLTFSNIANYMKRSGFHVSSQISQVLYNQWPTLDENEQNIVFVTKLLSNVGYFMTKESLSSFQDKLTDLLHAHQDNIPPSTVVELIETLKRFAGHIKPKLSEVASSIYEKKLDPSLLWHLSRAPLFLHELKNPLRDRICSLANQQLNDSSVQCLRTSDFVSLLNLHNSLNYPNNSEKILEHVLEQHICDLDVILLKYVSYTKVMANTKNQRVVDAFCNRVLQKVDDLMESLSCLLIVTQCLAKISNRPQHFDKIFSQYLMRQVLDEQLGTQPQHVAVVGRFLTQCFTNLDKRLLGLFTGRVISTISYFSLPEMAHIGLGVTNVNNLTTRAYNEQLITNFAREILTRRKEIVNVDTLNLLVKSVFIKLGGIFRDAVIQDLVEWYAYHAKTLTAASVYHVATILGDLRLQVPEVCERIANIIISDPSCVNLNAGVQTLKMFATCNYQSDNLNVLQEIVTSKALKCLEETHMNNNIPNILMAALSLSVLRCFPETLIRKIFSLPFLTNLDNMMMKKTSMRFYSCYSRIYSCIVCAIMITFYTKK